MIIGIDIGNTTVEIGFIKEYKFIKSYKLASNREKTIDDWFLDIFNIFSIEKNKPQDCIISSVVPQIEQKIFVAIEKLLGKNPLIVGKDIKVPIVNKYKNPDEVGIDRLVNAFSALKKQNPPLIVIDLGTAITFDIVNEKGEYEGGLIFPGIESSVDTLFSKTSKLPMVKVEKPKNIIGKTTVDSIKSGIFYGYCSLIDGLIKKIKSKTKKNFNIILTGGNSELISNCIEEKHIVDKFLAMEGLYLIYKQYLDILNKT
ncbi:type III pantothenate kinase [Hydrogenothermus marinus]|uniref:Type III pantothenate kinase n=1 Tax=Hydrogenothermus marinus TaxID=133270 RepID=A0A3M0BF62_9AQUI|nr:type III pantothenate kinase [Hydrogenothermus marinus]RMA96053.1 type III pantothenate kinase [Hydrogenothermus marinus]